MKLIVSKNNVPISEVQVETPELNERYEIFVGRAEDCHVQIDDPLISRHHFVIKNGAKGWVCEKLTQLGSILINGSSSPINPLNNGSEIKFGSYSILITELTEMKAAASISLTETNPVIEEAPIDDLETIDDMSLAEQAPVESLEETEGLDSFESLAEESPVEEEFSDESFQELGNDENDLGITSEEEITDNLVEETSDDDPFASNEEISSDVVNFDDENGALVDSFSNEGNDEGTRFLKAFVNYQLVLFGDHAPYDRFQIDQDEVFIGRDANKCQIILNDPEVSSVHAVLRKKNADVTIEDLNSSNGTILNGERINKAHISTGDDFVIGSTTFTLEVRSDLLDAESDRLMPVEADQVIETEEFEEEEISMEDAADLDFSADAPQEKSIIKRIWKNPAQRKKAIYGVVGLTLAFVLLYEEPEETIKPEPVKVATEAPNEKPKLQLSKELENKRNVAYELGVNFFEQNKYFEALREFQLVVEIDPEYKKVVTYLEQTKVGLKKLEELEAQKRAEEERIKTKKIIDELLAKAREAVKERQVQTAENYFGQITEKDPENIEVQHLKMELEGWQKAEEKKLLEIAAKEAARKGMVDALAQGKTFYLKREWYRATLKLEEFLRRKGTDEDLIKEASEMLSDAKNQLASDLGPLLGKARSLKEGQDYKSAYEAFLDVLKVEPTNAEALNEVDDIKFQLESRSKKIYREAIIAESLSLFNDAKEKFQEVQQISPTDSEYYKKATDKLKNYLE